MTAVEARPAQRFWQDRVLGRMGRRKQPVIVPSDIPQVSQERPAWKDEAQALISKWGTQEPLSWDELMTPIYGSTGRNTLEKTDPAINIAGVPNEFRPVHLGDSREGSNANKSAMGAVNSNLDSMLGTLSYVRSIIHPYRKKPTLEGIANVISAAVMLSNYLVWRARNPLENGEIPTDIAGLVAVARGLSIPFDQIAMGEMMQKDYGSSVQVTSESIVESVKSFVGHVFNEDYLNKPGKKIACPAPRELIEKVAAVLLEAPDPGMEEAGKRLEHLGLSSSEISFNLYAFGKAVRRGSIERNIWKGLVVSADAENAEQIADHYKTLISEHVKNQLRVTNTALGRNVPTAFTASDIPELRIQASA